MMERAWWHGLLKHFDPKKYPKKAELLWNPDADKMSGKQMLILAMAMAKNGSKYADKLKKLGMKIEK